jgi:zinc protease
MLAAQPVTHDHPSGLRVVLVHQPGVPVTALQFWVRVGSGDESEAEAGLAHVHEHMIFKGTEQRGVGQVAGDIEALGGNINAWTSFDQTVYHIVVPSRFAAEGLDVLADSLRNSRFDPDELQRELLVIDEEIRRGDDMPTRVFQQAVFSASFGDHPYGRPVIGTRASVAAFTHADVRRFYERWYRPDNMTLVAVGDVSWETLSGVLDRYWGRRAPSARLERPVRPATEDQSATRAFVLQRDVQQARFVIAFPGPALSDADQPALDLLAHLLGGGDSSVLYERVQRRQRLTNHIGASLYAPAQPGALLISGAVQGNTADAVLAALDATLRELAELHDQPLLQRDLDRARVGLDSSVIYGRQTVQGYADRLGYYDTVAGDLTFEAAYLEKAHRVTLADLQRMARRYLRPERATVGVLLPEGLDASQVPAEADLIARVTRAWNTPRTLRLADAQEIREGIHVWQAPSGMRVVVQHDPNVETYALRAIVPGGSVHEGSALAGASSLLSELFHCGTETRSAGELARHLEDMAASLSANSGRHTLGVSMRGLARDFDAGVELFADVLLASTCPPSEFERVRAEVIQAAEASRDSLSGEVYRAFDGRMFADHPYGRSLDSVLESLRTLSREQVMGFYRGLVRPEHMVVVMVGQVDPERALRTLAAAIPEHMEGQALELGRPAEPTLPQEPARVELFRDRQQAHLVVGWPAVPMGHPDADAQDVLATILNGQSGRLFLELRDRQSLAYSVGAYASAMPLAGHFSIYLATSPSRLEEAIEAVRAQVEVLRAEGVTEDDVERARRLLLGRRDVSLQTPGARASLMGYDLFYGFPADEYLRYAERLAAVDAASVHALIRRLLTPDREVITVLRPQAGQVPASP